MISYRKGRLLKMKKRSSAKKPRKYLTSGEWAQGVKKQCVAYKGGKCSVCGYKACLGALEFHHINPQDKKTRTGREAGNFLRSKFTDKTEKELDKCVLVCANCHREIHYFHTEFH